MGEPTGIEPRNDPLGIVHCRQSPSGFEGDDLLVRWLGELHFQADTRQLVPQAIDWRDTVRRHPMASVLSVGLVGYLVGRTKGAAIMAGLTAGLSTAMMRQLSDVFEGDFFDF